MMHGYLTRRDTASPTTCAGQPQELGNASATPARISARSCRRMIRSTSIWHGACQSRSMQAGSAAPKTSFQATHGNPSAAWAPSFQQKRRQQQECRYSLTDVPSAEEQAAKGMQQLEFIDALHSGRIGVVIHMLGDDAWAGRTPDEVGRTLLHCLAQSGYGAGNVVLAHLDGTFSRFGADYLNIQDQDGLTALHSAVSAGNRGLTEALLSAGANANCVSLDGFAPLHLASRSGQLDVVKVLLAAGANVNTTTKDGRTALDVAATKDIAHLLRSTMELQ